MNKRMVDELIPQAYGVLAEKDIGIADEQGKIDSRWRGQISSFGASVAQGSLLAAVSFFSAQGGAEVDRSKLMKAIAKLLNLDKPLFDYVKAADPLTAKENVINAAIAIKLAMSLYDMGKGA